MTIMLLVFRLRDWKPDLIASMATAQDGRQRAERGPDGVKNPPAQKVLRRGEWKTWAGDMLCIKRKIREK